MSIETIRISITVDEGRCSTQSKLQDDLAAPFPAHTAFTIALFMAMGLCCATWKLGG
jgi:hypothetical protein